MRFLKNPYGSLANVPFPTCSARVCPRGLSMVNCIAANDGDSSGDDNLQDDGPRLRTLSEAFLAAAHQRHGGLRLAPWTPRAYLPTGACLFFFDYFAIIGMVIVRVLLFLSTVKLTWCVSLAVHSGVDPAALHARLP